MNMKNVLSFQNCSLSVGLYFYVLFHLKKTLIFRCELLYSGGGIRFWSSGLHLSVKSHQGHGLIIPGDLKLVLPTPCKLFRQQPGTSAKTSHVLGHAATWRYCSSRTEEYIDRLCCKSSAHLKSKLCPQGIATQMKCPLSCINQYLLRSLFWWQVKVSRQKGFFWLAWD